MRFRSKRTSRPVEAKRAVREAQRVGAVRSDAVGEIAPRRLFDRFRHLRLHEPVGSFGDQVGERDAVDDVERIQPVAACLRHLLAFGIAHEPGDVDFAKRHFADEVQRHHDHPRDPEEDDVVAGHEDVGRVVHLELARFLRPAERAERPHRRRKPGLEHVFFGRQRYVVGEFVLAARFGFVARDVDRAVGVVPRGNPVSPPLLAADAPVADVAHPREVQVFVLLRYELDVAALDRFDRWLRQRIDRDEPLVRQQRFDDRVGAIAARHHQFVGFDLVDESGRGQIVDDALSCNGAVESAIAAWHVFVEVRIDREDVDHRQVVALTDLVVVEVVRRRDLHAAAAECRIDVRVGDDRDLAIRQRQKDEPANEILIPRVVRVHRNGGVAEHRFGPRRRDDDVVAAVRGAGAVAQRITEVPEAALLFGTFDFEVGDRGFEFRVPVDEPAPAIDQTFVVEPHEGFAYRHAKNRRPS